MDHGAACRGCDTVIDVSLRSGVVTCGQAEIHVHPTRTVVVVAQWASGPLEEQEGSVQQGESRMVEMTETQQVRRVLSFRSARGNPAQVDTTSLVYETSDPLVITVEVDPADPLRILVKAVAPGAARLTGRCDVDLGDGVQLLAFFEDYSISGGRATAVDFGPAVPEEQVI